LNRNGYGSVEDEEKKIKMQKVQKYRKTQTKYYILNYTVGMERNFFNNTFE